MMGAIYCQENGKKFYKFIDVARWLKCIDEDLKDVNINNLASKLRYHLSENMCTFRQSGYTFERDIYDECYFDEHDKMWKVIPVPCWDEDEKVWYDL